ncbi:YwiC-like family protein [Gloeocapsopsis crepidinum LEGE 06123]|uniref:YwiC-like family protein n=1 Tax=Gloeocapsopsis crepidinum LEGE 06123 TaxID=588587 RepID=A0ABR9UWB0_9CHRO|nr:YwiC-like family protein [Gloeocapsopsis crepidinum]MBE9191603.1 YwiC-like family protein [Gloeocapsopsis crepidinum LEGE 06123]
MTPSQPNSIQENSASQSQSLFSHAPVWYRPTFSPEHGVYVVLFVSFLTGAAAAQQWTLATTLALICAFAGFQAEHPLVLQIKQRRSWKPRFLVWGGIYTGIALSLAVYLYLQTPVLVWLYLGAIAAFAIDAISVFYRQQKSVMNELLTFAAVCLAASFAYIATTGTWVVSLLGLWLLNTLFFSSAIFTVKLRKPKTASLVPGVIYHAIASVIVGVLWYIGWLTPIAAIAFGIVLLKFGLILVRREWYRTTRIQNVAMLETVSALLFFVIVAIALLPAHLS